MRLQLESVVSWFDHPVSEHNSHMDYNLTKPLDLDYLNRIWRPDLYMGELVLEDSRESHLLTFGHFCVWLLLENLVHVGTPKFMGEPMSLRIRPKRGELFYKARLSPVVKCHMTFVYYPADTQVCRFILRSCKLSSPYCVFVEGGIEFDV